MLESRSDRDERLGRVLLETVLGIYWEHQSDAILAINLYGYGQLRDEVRNLGGFVTKERVRRRFGRHPQLRGVFSHVIVSGG